MPSKRGSVPGTSSGVTISPDGLARVTSAAPICAECGDNKNVVRFWHGNTKMWVCSIHFRITSTKRKDATLKQRVLHRLPEADSFELREVLPNRAMRRRRTR